MSPIMALGSLDIRMNIDSFRVRFCDLTTHIFEIMSGSSRKIKLSTCTNQGNTQSRKFRNIHVVFKK